MSANDNTKTQSGTRAVIYARVSSPRQVAEGHGLESQATRCREYAERKGYEIVETFFDKAISGSLSDRPGVMAMLSYLKHHSREGEIVVVIDDISRLARDTRVHTDLRLAIGLAGGRLESPSITFGEDSDSIFVENVLASASQHQRQKNGEQTKNRMRARAMNGYWVFHAPTGYVYKKVHGHGQLLVRDEPLASIVQEALEGFASGRFQTQAEVKRFLESQPEYPCKTAAGTVRYEEVLRLLSRPHYAGYIEVPHWGVSLRKGHHEGLIDLQTFERIQQRIKGGARVFTNNDIGEDFPLRGYAVCAECGGPLTAGWSKSKTGKRHPYYLCFAKGCTCRGKSIKRDVIEEQFGTLLQGLSPSAQTAALFKDLFFDAWEQYASRTEEIAKALRNDLRKTEQQIEQLLDRIVESSTASVIAAYERRIAGLEKDKLIIIEKLQESAAPRRSAAQQFEPAFRFLENPHELWVSERLDDKKLVLKLTFADRLAYCRNQGFRTPKTTLPFKALQAVQTGKCKMAETRGFEPLIPL
ncbi:recombinase family protein [Hyphomicrobium sp.]|uniref:recombinase family protein n=1 Tax=Hyphomicrobium sp. TaxID=82 RepID=UPI0025BA8B99|nr:recombinase family protein [Hyphomicrobium sp.]MCC7253615.1 recombinase family protein [Hyphomicrobium sp.]